MSDIETDIARAKRAELLLNDDLLKEAFATLEAEYIKFWMATRATETDTRERTWLAIKIIGAVQSHLHTVINNGVVAQSDLEMLKAEQAAA